MFGLGSLDDIIIRIAADVDSAMAGIAKVEASVKHMDRSVANSAARVRGTVKSMGKAMVNVGTISAVAAGTGVAHATHTFMEYEQAVANAASVTGAAGEEYERVRGNIEKLSETLGETTVFSASEAANAMYDLASAGYDVGSMAVDDVKPMLDLAAATQTNLAETTQSVTSALGQFDLGMEDSQRVSDVFSKTISSSKATMDKLTSSFRYVGPIAHQMEMSIEETAGALGVLYNSGLRGEQAGTNLKTALLRLVDPTADMKGALEELGLTLDDINPETNSLIDILTTLSEKNISNAQTARLFGKEGAVAMSTLISKYEDVDSLTTQVGDSTGTSAQMAEKQLDTLGGAIKLLKSAFEGLEIAIGEKVAPMIGEFAKKLRDNIPAIKEFVTEGIDRLKEIITDLKPSWDNLKSMADSAKGIFEDIMAAFDIEGDNAGEKFTSTVNKITDIIAKLMEWIDEHPRVTKFAVAVGTFVVAFSYLVPLVTTIATLAGSVAAFIGALAGGASVMAAITTAAPALGAAITFLTGPIGIAIAAVALLATAWATNFMGIREKTYAAIAKVKEIVGAAKEFLSDHKDQIVTALKLMINPIGAIVYAFKHWDEIRDIVGKIVKFLTDKLSGLADMALDWGKNTIGSFVDGFKHWDEIRDIVGKIVKFLTDKLSGLADMALDWGKNIIGSFVDGIKQKVDDLKDTVVGVGETVADYLGIHSPAKKGPLSELMVWGPNLAETFAKGIEDNKNAVENVLQSLETPEYKIRPDVEFPANELSRPEITPLREIDWQAANTRAKKSETKDVKVECNLNIDQVVVREEQDIDRIVEQVQKALDNQFRSMSL